MHSTVNKWRLARVALCRQPGEFTAAVDIEGREYIAHARASGQCAFVFAAESKTTFPMSSWPPCRCFARFYAQQALVIGRAEATDARAAAAKAHQLAKAIDAARGAAAELNQQLRSEHQRKDEFLAMLAHELRNPLLPMTTAIGVMRRTPERDPALLDRQLTLMTRQLHQLTHLVDDLLDVSRVSLRLIELRRVEELLATALDASRPLVESRGHPCASSRPKRRSTCTATAYASPRCSRTCSTTWRSTRRQAA